MASSLLDSSSDFSDLRAALLSSSSFSSSSSSILDSRQCFSDLRSVLLSSQHEEGDPEIGEFSELKSEIHRMHAEHARKVVEDAKAKAESGCYPFLRFIAFRILLSCLVSMQFLVCSCTIRFLRKVKTVYFCNRPWRNTSRLSFL